MVDFGEPTERARYAATHGIDAYNRALKVWQNRLTVATVNGYPIRRTPTRFGVLYAVVGSRMAFATQAQAADHASTLPPATNEPRA